MIKIFLENLYWEGMLLVFTWHAKEELDRLRKPVEFVMEILEYGKHILVSKKQNKFNVFYPFQKKWLCLSYVKENNTIIIHTKPTTRIRQKKK